MSSGEDLKKHAALVRKGGALVTTIHDADEPWFRERGITATNIVMNQTPQSSPQGLDEVVRMVVDSMLAHSDHIPEEPADQVVVTVEPRVAVTV